MHRFQPLILTFAMVFALLMVNCGSEDPILECEGECSCDYDTRECSCAGGTTCTLEGDDVTFYCDGNASCDLTCGLYCHVVCPGTTGCTTTLGDGSSAECQGTATCDFTCEGDCDISCGGTSNCSVECHEDCEQDGLSCIC